MAEIPIGAKREQTLLVTTEYAINFMGNEGARVLGTPFLIAFMEITSRNLLLDYIDKGFDSVGTTVNVRHLAATPLGMSVRFHSQVVKVEDRRVTFRVSAHDEKELVGEGEHERFIVNVERFAQRLAAKRAG